MSNIHLKDVRVVNYLPVITIVAAVLVIIGWILNFPLLIQLHPSWVPMQFNTALCILLSSFSLLIINKDTYIKLINIFAIFVFIVSFLTLFQYVLSIDLKVDQLFFNHYITTLTQAPGRMAPNTAVSFLVISFAIFVKNNNYKFNKYLPINGAVLLGVGLASIISYFGEFDTSVVWSTATKMALHTAISMVIIGLFILLTFKFEDSDANFNIALSSSIVVLQLVFISTIILAIFKTESINNKQVINELKRSIQADITLYVESNEEEKISEFIMNKYYLQIALNNTILLDSLKDYSDLQSNNVMEMEFSVNELNYKVSVLVKDYSHEGRFKNILIILLLILVLSSTSIIFTFFIIQSRAEKKYLTSKNSKIVQLLSEKQLLLDVVPTSIVILDGDREIKDLNNQSEQYLEYNKNELIGLSIDTILPQLSVDIKKRLDTEFEVFFEDECFIKSKSGKFIPFDVRIAKIDRKSKDVSSGYILSAYNLSEEYETKEKLHKINKELAEKNKELESFAFVASHDLKEPLRGIGQLIEWIESDLRSGRKDAIDKYFRLAKDRISRLLSIQSGLLEYSKIDKSKYQFDILNIEKSISNCFDLVNNKFNAEIKFIGEMNYSITTLVVPFEQIITNLLANSIKHNNKEKIKIIVEFVNVTNGIKILISDNGPGIPVEFHDKVFGVFKTIKSKDENLGSGIGLAIVKKVLNTFGGSIFIINDSSYNLTFELFWPHEDVIRTFIRKDYLVE